MAVSSLLLACDQEATSETPSSKPRGIGVSRPRVESIFNRPEYGGLKMEFSPLADGTTRYLGQSQNGLWLLDLVGGADALTSASMTVHKSVNSFDFGLLMGIFVRTTVPEWDEPGDWVIKAVQYALLGEGTSTTYAGKRITLDIFPGVDFVSMTVERE